MKKILLLIIFLAAAIAGGLYFSQKPEKLPSIIEGPDIKELRRITLSFLEDLRFKDFDQAATYHTEEDQEKVDISKLIERLFAIKPELLDIQKYEILEIEKDSSGNRARVRIRSTVKPLNTSHVRDVESIIYFFKINDQWFMELESSLH